LQLTIQTNLCITMMYVLGLLQFRHTMTVQDEFVPAPMTITSYDCMIVEMVVIAAQDAETQR